MDTDKKSLRQVQVALFWGNTPLDVVQVKQKQGLVLAGSARSCAIPLPPDLLPHPDFPLLEIGPDQIVLRAGQEAVFEQEQGDNQWRQAETYKDTELGVLAAELQGNRRMRLGLGRLGLVVSRVRVKPVAPRRLIENLEPAFINSLLLAIFFATAFISTLLLGPKALGSDEVRLHKRNSAYIKTIFSRIPKKTVFNPVVNEELKAKPMEKLAAGKAGKAGKLGVPDTGRRRSVKAIRPDDRERLSRLGLVAVLNDAPGLPGTLDNSRPGGLGGEMEDAIGGIDGKEYGESGGMGGLALRGPGRGGGGTSGLVYAPGLVRRTGTHIDSIGEKVKYTKPKEKQIDITVADLKIIGSLPKKVIRDVIRSHRQQIRYCFERELARHPTLAGYLRVHFLIDYRGRVKWAKQDAARGISHTNLSSCILKRVRTWQFPQPKGGGDVEVRYPFIFSHSGE